MKKKNGFALVTNKMELDAAITMIVVVVCPKCQDEKMLSKTDAAEILEKEGCKECSMVDYMPDPVIMVRNQDRHDNIVTKISKFAKTVKTTKKTETKEHKLPDSKFNMKPAKPTKKMRKSKFDVPPSEGILSELMKKNRENKQDDQE